MSDTQGLTIVQDDFQPLEVADNVERAAEHLRQSPADSLVVFPELTLTGYGVGGRAKEVASALTAAETAPEWLAPLATTASTALVGLVERGPDQRLFNASVLLGGGRVVSVHRKHYLPTYGMFDEGRVFAPDRTPPPVIEMAGGWRIGVLICEDLWHPSLSWLLAMQGADLIVVQAAAPGRGGHDGDAGFSSMERWALLARATAVQYGVYLALANRSGVEGGLTFGGGSLLVDPHGTEIWRAGGLGPARFETTLSRETLREARQPFSHLRDEDPHLLLRGIRSLLRDGTP